MGEHAEGEAQASLLTKNHAAWATGGDNGALAHSAVNEYLVIEMANS